MAKLFNDNSLNTILIWPIRLYYYIDALATHLGGKTVSFVGLHSYVPFSNSSVIYCFTVLLRYASCAIRL